MKPSPFILLIFGILTLLFSSVLSGQLIQHPQMPEFDEQTIKSELIEMLLRNQIPGYNERYGFYSDDEVQSINFGNPVAFYIITVEEITTNYNQNKFEMTFLDEWWVPLIVTNEVRSFVFLKNRNGQVTINGYGSKIVADEMVATKVFDYNNDKQGFLFTLNGNKFLIKDGENDSAFFPLGYTGAILNLNNTEYLSGNSLICILYSHLTGEHICTTKTVSFSYKQKIKIINSNSPMMLKVNNETGLHGTLSFYTIEGISVAEIPVCNMETLLQLPQSGLFIYRFRSDNGEMQSGKVFVK